MRASGLLALSIPREHGGGGAWADALAVVRQLARVDGSLAHVFGFHHLMLATVRLFGDAAQWRSAYRGDASSSAGSGATRSIRSTRARRIAGSRRRARLIDGRRASARAPGDSDMLIVSALDAGTRGSRSRRSRPTAPESRCTTTGTTWASARRTAERSIFREVRVDEAEILQTPGPLGSVFASLRPCIAQLILANVYLGIGEGALAEARAFTQTRARPWIDLRCREAERGSVHPASLRRAVARPRAGARALATRGSGAMTPGSRATASRRSDRGSLRARDSGRQGADDARRPGRDQPHVRGRWARAPPSRARPRPVLAKPAHAHAARSRSTTRCASSANRALNERCPTPSFYS